MTQPDGSFFLKSSMMGVSLSSSSSSLTVLVITLLLLHLVVAQSIGGATSWCIVDNDQKRLFEPVAAPYEYAIAGVYKINVPPMATYAIFRLKAGGGGGGAGLRGKRGHDGEQMVNDDAPFSLAEDTPHGIEIRLGAGGKGGVAHVNNGTGAHGEPSSMTFVGPRGNVPFAVDGGDGGHGSNDDAATNPGFDGGDGYVLVTFYRDFLWTIN